MSKKFAKSLCIGRVGWLGYMGSGAGTLPHSRSVLSLRLVPLKAGASPAPVFFRALRSARMAHDGREAPVPLFAASPIGVGRKYSCGRVREHSSRQLPSRY
jgi:hypothetical protein